MNSSSARHIFLDLEDTVITPAGDGWHRCQLLPGSLAKIRAYLQAWAPAQVHLFSFALSDAVELAKFNQSIRPALEDALGCSLRMTPLSDTDVLPACCRIRGLHPRRVDFEDMSNFWSKQDSFRLFVQDWSARQQHPGLDVVLFDDAVVEESFEFPHLGIRGHLFNIDLLPDGAIAIPRVFQ